MTSEDLTRLIRAVETGNPAHYHGDVSDGILEALHILAGIDTEFRGMEFSTAEMDRTDLDVEIRV